MRTSRLPILPALAALAVSILLWNMPGAQLLLWPCKLLVTFLHEGAHAVAALATGGQVASIAINPNTSGVTYTLGGWGLLTSTAGYLGTALLGALLLRLGALGGWARPVLLGLAMALGVGTLVWVRNPFGFLVGLLFAAVLVWVSRKASAGVQEFIFLLLSLQIASNALLDSFNLVSMSSTPVFSDALNMQQMTGIPAIVWAALWSVLAVIAVAWGLAPWIAREKSVSTPRG